MTQTRGLATRSARMAILRAGLELFIERGIEGASIEQIAKRAGVGKLTIYRRWPAKEDLIAAAIETLVANEVEWPSDEEIDQVSPYQLTEAALSKSAETAAAPEFRALVARILGSAVSHPSLMATYGSITCCLAESSPAGYWSGRSSRERSRPTPTWTC